MNAAVWMQVLLAYLLGSIPSAWLAGKILRGLDIRQHGSGNMGATNVFRVLGPGPGVAVLLADVCKGVAAVLLLPRVGGWGSGAPLPGLDEPAWWPCLLGLAAVLGHSFTVFLRFKGGKGVATSLGVFLGLAPLATLVALLVFGVVLATTRMVSAGSLAGAAVLPWAVTLFKEGGPAGVQGAFLAIGYGAWSWRALPVFWLALVLALLIWLRHLPNLKRILDGTESRIGRRGARGPGGAAKGRAT